MDGRERPVGGRLERPWPEPTWRIIMSDTTTKGGKAAGATPFEMPKVDFSKFELPKFDFGKFDLSKMELPPAFRDIADKGAAQLRDAYDKAKVAGEETSRLIEETYATTSKGVVEANLKALEIARDNVNAAFDHARELAGVKSLPELIELSTTYARGRVEALTKHGEQFAALGQKLAAETGEPLRAGVKKAFTKAN
jgi:phasin